MRSQIPQPTEIQIMNQIMGYLKFKGFYVQRMNSGALRDRRNRLIRMNRAGTPDILAFRPLTAPVMFPDGSSKVFTELLFIECKRPGLKPTQLQTEVMKELSEHGAKVFVATSIEDVEKELGL